MALTTGAAILGAAALGTGAQIYGAKKGAKAQQQALDQSQAMEERMYQQNRADMAPWRQTGERALSQLAGMYGVGESGEQITPDYSMFEQSPDYQFAYDQGMRGAKGQLASMGMSDSGAALKSLSRYNQGFASQRLRDYKNQLASLAGIGQTAAESEAARGTAHAGSMSQGQKAMGDVRASSYGKVAEGVGDAASTYGLYKMGAYGDLGSTPTQTMASMGSTQAGYSPNVMNAWAAGQ